MNTIWPFTFSFLLFASVAAVSPYLVMYYQKLGFTGAQIGLLTGVTPLITLFGAPLWTGLADLTRRHRLIMSIATLMGVVAMLLFPMLRAFVPVLLVSFLLNIFFAPVSSFADSATMTMLGDKKELYGRVRLGGTLGFALTAPVVGRLVQNYGLQWAFYAGAILFFLQFLVSQKLEHGRARSERARLSDLRPVLTNPRLILFLVLAIVSGVALAASNTYFFPYMKSLGAQESMMGLMLTVGTFSEVPVLFWGNRLIKWLKPYGLLMLTVAVTGVRFLWMAALKTPEPVLFVQLLNGLTFPAMWIAGVSYVNENAPPGLNTTLQGIFGAMVFGLGNAIGGFVGGPLLENLGGGGLYLTFGGFTLAVLAAVVGIQNSRLMKLPIKPAQNVKQ